MEPEISFVEEKQHFFDKNLVVRRSFFQPFWLNFCWSFTVYSVTMSVVLYFFIQEFSAIKAQLTTINFVLVNFGLIVLLLLYTFLMVISILVTRLNFSHFKEQIFYALFSLNVVWFGFLVRKAFRYQVLRFKISRWKIFDIVLMGIMIALFLIMKAISDLIPTIPVIEISLSLQYLVLMFICFLTGSFWKTFFCGMVTGFLTLVFPSTIFLNFFQFTFDYLIPNLVFALTFFIYFSYEEKQTAFQKVQWVVFSSLPFLLVYLSHVISGMLFWNAGVWPGTSVAIFAIVWNAPNSAFDLIMGLIFAPLIFKRLWVLKNKYEQLNNR